MKLTMTSFYYETGTMRSFYGETGTHSSIDHRTYFQTSKGHVTWIIWKVNSIPTHCGLAYESIHSLARGHMIRV